MLNEKEKADWESDKKLVRHLLLEYGDSIKKIYNSIEELKIQVAILNTKMIIGSVIISTIISVAVAFISKLK